MAIDWQDNQKRKAFRQALEFVYPNFDALEGFVDEELNENLATIAGQGSPNSARKLIKWAIAQGCIEALFNAFCNENLDNSGVAQQIAEIRCEPLVASIQKITDAQWDDLFQSFTPWDFAEVARAFLTGFSQAMRNDFKIVYPKQSPPNSLEDVRGLLEDFDNPTLAVRLVEQAIARLRSEQPQRDLSGLEVWRDQVSVAHGIDLVAPPPPTASACAGYLLVALQETGQFSKTVPQVNVFAELHITGEAHPRPLGMQIDTCPVSQVAQHLQPLIDDAEGILLAHCTQTGADFARITLELFLSGEQIETDVTQWPIPNPQGDSRPLISYRRLMVRSLDRAITPTTQALIKRNWQNRVRNANAAQQFHVQRNCPKPGDCNMLEDIPGLKLVAALPQDRLQRQSILYDIVNGALPIVLWFSQTEDCTPAQRLAAMESLLEQLDLTNVAALAQRWRTRRLAAADPGIQHLRLLCDCPDRWPDLPGTSETDALVAS